MLLMINLVEAFRKTRPSVASKEIGLEVTAEKN
jgi:hypothetical protein